MREIVGFAAGLLAGSVGAALVSSESGRRLRERLMAEAEPEIRTSLAEWDPLLREVARAVRIGANEVQATAAQVRAYLAELAAEQGADETGGAMRDEAPDAVESAPIVPSRPIGDPMIGPDVEDEVA